MSPKSIIKALEEINHNTSIALYLKVIEDQVFGYSTGINHNRFSNEEAHIRIGLIKLLS